MRQLRLGLLMLSVVVLTTALAPAQDDSQPSLGDVARQARLKKQKEARADAKDQKDQADQVKDQQTNGSQSNNAQDKNAQPHSTATSNQDAAGKAAADKIASGNDTLLVKGSKKVITNEEIPEHVGPTSTLPQHPRIPNTPDQPAPYNADGKVPAEYWKNQIRVLKESITNLESTIQDVTDSIRYASGSCVSNCQQWNEQQQQKEQQVKMMTAQLEQAQKSLEAMQDTARKQGYGSSVYDP